VIPDGLYRGNDSPTPTFGVRVTLVTRAATPDDVGYLVGEVGVREFEEFKGFQSALAHLDPREMPGSKPCSCRSRLSCSAVGIEPGRR
jgi:TRAP-type uncharacterized transport system substrate-binding protein